MTYSRYVLFLVVLISCAQSLVYSKNTIEFLNPFISSLHQPLSLNLQLCWKEEAIFLISKMVVSNLNVTFSRNSINDMDLPNGRLEHGSLVLMDLECPETFEFLHQLQWKKFEGIRWLFLNANRETENEILSLINSNRMGPASEIFYVIVENTSFMIYQGKFIFQRGMPWLKISVYEIFF